MFGHRWLREEDYEAMRGMIERAVAAAEQFRDRTDALRERLIDAEASKRSAMTMRDGLVTRVNQLEEESAMLRHKLTGLPQIAPKIERGTGLRASEIGAGVDLFEDVGDSGARDLQERGMLHETEALPVPSAETLTEHLN